MKKSESSLLADAFIANQIMVARNIECWLSSINYNLQKLDIQQVENKLNFFQKSCPNQTYSKLFR